MKTVIITLLSVILLSATTVNEQPKKSTRMEVVETLTGQNEKYTILRVDSSEYLVNHRGGIIKL